MVMMVLGWILTDVLSERRRVCRRAEKDAGSCLYNLAEHMWKQMGVKLYFFVSYTNTKNQHVTGESLLISSWH